jgi:hypothetical protein
MIKIKCKFLPVLNYALSREDVWGRGGMTAAFLTSALDDGELAASFPRTLYPRGKSPAYQLDRRLGGPKKLSGSSGEEKYPLGCRK